MYAAFRIHTERPVLQKLKIAIFFYISTASVVKLADFLATDPGVRVRLPVLPDFWGPLSLVSTIEELLGRKCSDSRVENRDFGRRDPSSWPRTPFYPQKLSLTSPARGGPSVGTVPSRTQATELKI
jgi:hypothetical protein